MGTACHGRETAPIGAAYDWSPGCAQTFASGLPYAAYDFTPSEAVLPGRITDDSLLGSACTLQTAIVNGMS